MTSLHPTLSQPPLIVIALGGNALSPPAGALTYQVERAITNATSAELTEVIRRGFRLLIVHGNGPQVGRLMRYDIEGDNLDICVAQTQGELGYLLAQGVQRLSDSACVSLITRTVVDEADPALKKPDKAVGPVLTKRPTGPCRQDGDGWRVLVGSPKPIEIIESPAIRSLLQTSHVVAGGGGGVAVTARGEPIQGVVDKDRVAALLAVELNAQQLIFVTDVEGVFSSYANTDQTLLAHISVPEVAGVLKSGSLGAGSMAHKVESAATYAAACRRPARIVAQGNIIAGLEGRSGTLIRP
jgi:carbamate kinase